MAAPHPSSPVSRVSFLRRVLLQGPLCPRLAKTLSPAYPGKTIPLKRKKWDQPQAPEKHLCQFHPLARDSELILVKGSRRARGLGARGPGAQHARAAAGAAGHPPSSPESQLAGRTGLTASGARRTLRKGKAEALRLPPLWDTSCSALGPGGLRISVALSSAPGPRLVTFDTGLARPARPALPVRPVSRAPRPSRLAGGFVGPSSRLCRASRGLAPGARVDGGAGGRGPRRSRRDRAPRRVAERRGREPGQREGLSGCALLWAAAGVGRLVLGLPLLCSPLGTRNKGFVYSQKAGDPAAEAVAGVGR